MIVDLVGYMPTNSTILVTAATAAIAPRALRALPTRPNYRGVELPFPAGIIAAAAGTVAARGRTLPLGAGVAVLGLIDDLVDAPPKGLRGHATAGITTGTLKAGGTIALAYATTRDARRAAVITLVSHVANVLDLRPGRATKAFLLLGAGLLGAKRGPGETAVFTAPLLVIGAYDLRERAMLGDTGSTLLGAMAGLWLTTALDARGLTLAAAGLTTIALVAELTSLSALIDRVPPLRALDWLGRRNADCLSHDPAPVSSSSPAGSSPRSARASRRPPSAACWCPAA